MGEAAMQFREEIRPKRENDYGLENALARYVRTRWPEKTIGHVQHEFGLSESEAAKVVYAGASKNTLRRILHHKCGGFGLFVELLADVTGVSLESFIAQQAEEARVERAQWEARERSLETMRARLAEPRQFGGRDA
jgi:hypothetical protein